MSSPILLGIFIFCIIVQLSYVVYFFFRVFFISVSKQKSSTSPKRKVSVIICAKNEAENLRNYLPAILTQDYLDDFGNPNFEVIVVNDGSEDHTENILRTMERKFSHLRHINISSLTPRQFMGKKFALSKGVKEAKSDWLLGIDADCHPNSTQWLDRMVQSFYLDKQIVCGYGAYEYQPGFLNAFTRWETLHTFIQYASYAMAGKPYMGVGRNIAFTKRAFNRAQNNPIWNKLPSGDDDLLVRIVGNKNNIAINATEETFTYSKSQPNWLSWLRQKQRHLSTGKYYRPTIKFLLGLYAFSHAAMWLLFFLLLNESNALLIIALLLLRCIPYWSIWHSAAKKMKEPNLGLWLPFCDIGWALYNFILSPFIFFKNQLQWK